MRVAHQEIAAEGLRTGHSFGNPIVGCCSCSERERPISRRNDGRRRGIQGNSLPSLRSKPVAGACRKGVGWRRVSTKRWYRIPTTACASSRSTSGHAGRVRLSAPTLPSAGQSRSVSTIPIPARANSQAKDDIAHGATGFGPDFRRRSECIWIRSSRKFEAMSKALDGIPLDQTYLRIDAHPQSRATIDWLVGLLTARRADPSRLHLSFGIDPAAVFAGTGRLRMSIEALQASMPQSLAHFFALGVPGVLLEADGRVFHNAGATEAQELGVMLASAVSHLRMFEEARQPLVYAAPHIGFSLSVDQDQFLSHGQDPRHAQTLGQSAGSLLDHTVGGDHPCGNLLPNDDQERSGDQYPADDHCRLCGSDRRGGFDIDPALHHCPWSSGSVRAPRRTQYAAGHGGRKPHRFRRRSGRRARAESRR